MESRAKILVAIGQVDLKAGLQGPGRDFQITSPPTVIGDVVVVGSSIPDNQAVNQAKGTVLSLQRSETAAPSGHLDPIPWAAQAKSTHRRRKRVEHDRLRPQTRPPLYTHRKRIAGLLRRNANRDGRDADSVAAVDALTGKKIWAFQVVHHDLWDQRRRLHPLRSLLCCTATSPPSPLRLRDGDALRPRPPHRRATLSGRRTPRCRSLEWLAKSPHRPNPFSSLYLTSLRLGSRQSNVTGPRRPGSAQPATPPAVRNLWPDSSIKASIPRQANADRSSSLKYRRRELRRCHLWTRPPTSLYANTNRIAYSVRFLKREAQFGAEKKRASSFDLAPHYWTIIRLIPSFSLLRCLVALLFRWPRVAAISQSAFCGVRIIGHP